MRTALIVLNLVIAAVSAGLFGYTFFARDHLVRSARDYVVRRTVEYANPLAGRAEAALADPRAVAVVPAAVREAAAEEIRRYRRDPHGYVRETVAGGAAAAEDQQFPFAEQISGWKKQTAHNFETTLAGLIRDLRIFSGTNVVAGLLAAWLTAQARGRWRYRVLAASVLLLLALGFNVYMFLDGLTFFRILLDARVGWFYPVMVALTWGYLLIRCGQFVPLAADEPIAPTGGNPPTAVG